MPPKQLGPTKRLQQDDHFELAALRRMAIAGLISGNTKTLPMEISYSTPARTLGTNSPLHLERMGRTASPDEKYGSLVKVPGYYYENADRVIFRYHTEQFASLKDSIVVDLGTGDGRKLCDLIHVAGQPRKVLAVDIGQNLQAAKQEICAVMPEEDVHTMHANFTQEVFFQIVLPAWIAKLGGGPVQLMLLGGTYGNFSMRDRDRMLEAAHPVLKDERSNFFISTDSTRDEPTLRRAYGQEVSKDYFLEGLTFAHTLVGVPKPDARKFEFQMRFSDTRDRVELRLISAAEQAYFFGGGVLMGLGQTLNRGIIYEEGERILCGQSNKPLREDLREEFATAGYTVLSDMPYEEAYGGMHEPVGDASGPAAFDRVATNIWRLSPARQHAAPG